MKIQGKIILLAAGVAIASSAVTAAVFSGFMSSAQGADVKDPIFSGQPVSGPSLHRVALSPASASGADFTTAAENTINGVVSIKSFATPRYSSRGASGNGGGFFNDPLFEYFFGGGQSPRRQAPRQQEQPKEQPTGLGSGVILSSDGYIVTNNHVIDEADRLEVTLNDNRSFDATVIGSDPTTDLALIKIDATELPVIPMGDSESMKVGEWVLAVGNPFGFTSTVTTGIVSAKSRSIGAQGRSGRMGIESYIQTDAAVNAGNSGGALVNLNGELIGINTAIYSQTGNYAGYSFAIPTSIVSKVVADLKQFGTVQRAMLGVGILDLTADLAKEKGITAVTRGVYVGEVYDRSSAMEAGLKEGDVIVKVQGVATDNMAQLQEQIAKHRPGDTVTVDYVRDNKNASARVKLRNPQGNTEVTRASDMADLGCAFKTVPEATLKQLGLSSGVQVKGLSSGSFSSAGVKEGFIISSINGQRVSSPSDVEKLHKQILQSGGDEKVMILRGVYPTGKRGIYAVDLSGVSER